MITTNDCCSAKKESKGFWQGALYGLLPHSICIPFIVASLVGATFLTNLIKPLMLSSALFYVLIGISIAAATLSSLIYLKRHNFLHKEGIRRKWKYLSWMYGLTIGINLLFFMLILPLFATSSSAIPEGVNSAQISLKVQIPCGGHAPLITQELQKVEGVQGIKFNLPNYFKINYNPQKVTPQQILSLPIFQYFPAQQIN